MAKQFDIYTLKEGVGTLIINTVRPIALRASSRQEDATNTCTGA